MRNHWAKGAALATLFLVVPARAADDVPRRVSLNAGMLFLEHTRKSSAPFDTTERGAIPAGAVEVQTIAPSRLFARIRFEAATGRTDFRVWDPTVYAINSTTAHTWIAPELAVGYRWEVNGDVHVVGAIGGGYHYWRRAIDVGGGKSTQRWGSLSLGTRVEASIAEPLELTIEAALVQSMLAAVSGESATYAPSSYSPVGKLGARARVGLRYEVASRVSVGALLGWEYTSFGQSPAVPLRLSDGSEALVGGHRVMSRQPAEQLQQLWILGTLGISG